MKELTELRDDLDAFDRAFAESGKGYGDSALLAVVGLYLVKAVRELTAAIENKP